MCNHKSGFYTIDDLELYWRFRATQELRVNFIPHYYENSFDHLLSPVMTAPGEVGLFSWGLIPWYTKGLDKALSIRNQTLNAISEEMFDKPAYRDSLRDHRRCLIPATGFFEWHWNDPKGKVKQPYFIQTNSKIFSFAGIWSSWTDEVNNAKVYTYSILTCPANPLLEKIHNNKKRMPVIIPDEYLNDWLNPNLTKEDVLGLCTPFDENGMDAYPIDRKIGNTKIKSDEKDVAEILAKVETTPLVVNPESKTKAKKQKGDPGQGSLF